jgi:hypothetical protein
MHRKKQHPKLLVAYGPSDSGKFSPMLASLIPALTRWPLPEDAGPAIGLFFSGS